MKQLITIRFRPNEPRFLEKQPDGWVHQLRNFGEDIWRTFHGSRDYLISLDEIDRASDSISLVVNHKRTMAMTLAEIERIRRKHFFDDITEVVVSPFK